MLLNIFRTPGLNLLMRDESLDCDDPTIDLPSASDDLNEL